jgi:hypothetical protein
MKKLLSGLFVFMCLVSCSSSKESSESADSSARIANQVSDSSATNDATENAEDTSDFILKSKRAGKFKIGDPINSLDKTPYQLIKTKELRSTEEGQEEVPMFVLISGKDKILSAYPEYDYGKSQYSEQIGEMRIYSPLFHTKKQVNPASSISDILKAYPNSKILYTYLSNSYWIETADLPSVQFILNADDFKGDKNAPVESEITEIKQTDFSPSSTVVYVRIN